MSEKLYRLMSNDSKQLYCIESVDGEMFSMQEIVDLLNEQQSTINELKERNAHNFAKKMQLMKENEQLRQELQKKQEEEQLYANEILELREANKEFLQFKELGGDY